MPSGLQCNMTSIDLFRISHLEIQLKSDKEELHKQKQVSFYTDLAFNFSFSWSLPQEYETRLNELQKALSQRVKEFEEVCISLNSSSPSPISLFPIPTLLFIRRLHLNIALSSVCT